MSDGSNLCQFRTNNFKYNSVDFSTKYNLYFIDSKSTSSSNSFLLNGIQGTVQDDDDTGDIKSFSKIVKSYNDIDVTICKIVNNNIIPMTKEDVDIINMELFQPKYCPLEIDNELILNCIITKSSSYFNSANQGYINVTLHSEPYYRSYIMTKEIFVRNIKSTTLENRSNVSGLLDINVEIELYNNTSYVKIMNNTTGNIIELDNLTDTDEKHIVVYGESVAGISMNYVQSVNNSDLNILKKTITRDWLKLMYGVNNFTIICNGTCRVVFSYQNKIALR